MARNPTKTTSLINGIEFAPSGTVIRIQTLDAAKLRKSIAEANIAETKVAAAEAAKPKRSRRMKAAVENYLNLPDVLAEPATRLADADLLIQLHDDGSIQVMDLMHNDADPSIQSFACTDTETGGIILTAAETDRLLEVLARRPGTAPALAQRDAEIVDGLHAQVERLQEQRRKFGDYSATSDRQFGDADQGSNAVREDPVEIAKATAGATPDDDAHTRIDALVVKCAELLSAIGECAQKYVGVLESERTEKTAVRDENAGLRVDLERLRATLGQHDASIAEHVRFLQRDGLTINKLRRELGKARAALDAKPTGYIDAAGYLSLGQVAGFLNIPINDATAWPGQGLPYRIVEGEVRYLLGTVVHFLERQAYRASAVNVSEPYAGPERCDEIDDWPSMSERDSALLEELAERQLDTLAPGGMGLTYRALRVSPQMARDLRAAGAKPVVVQIRKRKA